MLPHMTAFLDACLIVRSFSLQVYLLSAINAHRAKILKDKITAEPTKCLIPKRAFQLIATVMNLSHRELSVSKSHSRVPEVLFVRSRLYIYFFKEA